MCLNSSWDPVKHQCEPPDRLGYVLNICRSLPLHGIGFATGLSPLSILRLHSPCPQDCFPTAWHSYLYSHSMFVSFCHHVLPACNSARQLTHPQVLRLGPRLPQPAYLLVMTTVLRRHHLILVMDSCLSQRSSITCKIVTHS